MTLTRKIDKVAAERSVDIIWDGLKEALDELEMLESLLGPGDPLYGLTSALRGSISRAELRTCMLRAEVRNQW